MTTTEEFTETFEDGNHCIGMLPVAILRIAHASLLAYIREGSVTVVVKEVVRLTWKTARTTEHMDSTKRAGLALPTRRVIQIPMNVARSEEVEPSIAVIIADTYPGGPVAKRYACLFSNVSKCTIVIVLVKAILAEVSNIDIGPPVIILVANC
jgi:hypothetical protein